MLRPHDRTPEAIDSLTRHDLVCSFATAVTRYRDQTSASVTSWGRTPRRNKFVRGAPASRHLVDLAVDVVYEDKPNLETATALARHLGLMLRREHDHDHLEPADMEGVPNGRR